MVGGMLMTFTNIFYISRTTKNKIASSRFFPHIQSDHLLEFINCGSKSGCDSNRCGCKRAKLQCTELFKCRTDCINATIGSKDKICSNYDEDDLSNGGDDE